MERDRDAYFEHPAVTDVRCGDTFSTAPRQNSLPIVIRVRHMGIAWIRSLVFLGRHTCAQNSPLNVD
jgi:hypothetical protein